MFNERLICEYLVNSHKLSLIVSRFTDRLKHKKINNCTGFYKHLLISGAKILALCKNKNMLWFFRIKEQCRGNQASSLTRELYDLTSFGFEGHVEFT